MQGKPYSKATLPNKEGFTFLAVFSDGSTKPDQVIKKMNLKYWPDGMHTCTYFKEMIGWYRIK